MGGKKRKEKRVLAHPAAFFILDTSNDQLYLGPSCNMLCLFVTVEFQVVSEDGKKVRRQQPFTESDVEELQVLSNLLPISYFSISGVIILIHLFSL